jgi:DNA-binding transcriptional MerR regulator
MNDSDDLFTLEGLADRVSARVRAAGLSQGNGQVSDLPDARTLRYYTTLGLMDRPAAMRDRRALYSERHVDQVVAVKRLQAAGHALRDIQGLLAGLGPKAIHDVAEGRRPRLGGGGRARDATSAGSVGSAPFWAAAPTPARRTAREADAGAIVPGVAANPDASRADAAHADATHTDAGDAAPGAGLLLGVPIGAGVTLLIPSPNPAAGDGALVTDEVRGALAAAAGPLLDELARAGLLDPTRPRSNNTTASATSAPKEND